MDYQKLQGIGYCRTWGPWTPTNKAIIGSPPASHCCSKAAHHCYTPPDLCCCLNIVLSLLCAATEPKPNSMHCPMLLHASGSIQQPSQSRCRSMSPSIPAVQPEPHTASSTLIPAHSLMLLPEYGHLLCLPLDPHCCPALDPHCCLNMTPWQS